MAGLTFSDSAFRALVTWATDYEARLPDPDGKGQLAGEFRSRLAQFFSEAFEPEKPPFDPLNPPQGQQTSPIAMLKALRFYLQTGDARRAMAASEAAWSLMRAVKHVTLS